MSSTINSLLDALQSGYIVKFQRFGNHIKISCSEDKEQPRIGHFDSVIPNDEFIDPQVSEIIEYNINRIKNDKS